MKKKSSALLKTILIIVVSLAVLTIMAIVRGSILEVHSYTVQKYCLSRADQSQSSIGVSLVETELESGKVTIVGLADLHGNTVGKNLERIIGKVKESNPDFILYLGDMVEKTQAEESAYSILTLTEQLIKIAPVYYVDGNHEQSVQVSDPELYQRLNESLADLGTVKLENKIVSFTVKNGELINLCGITKHYYWGDTEKCLVGELKEMEGINVLACHYPESVIWYGAFEDGGLDLALCGHTHGGLVRVPFLGGYYAPEQSRWPMYDLGEYRVYTDTTWWSYGGKDGADYLGTMIISGGLAGEHGIPRINNPMEISVVEID